MNKKVITLTIFVILGIIIVPTIYKIYDNHQKQLIIVVQKEFYYQAKKCYNASLCEKKVSLKDLYEHKYFQDKLTNPITKKYYEEDSYVNLETNEIKLNS